MLKVASWNVNSLPVRINHVLQWLEKAAPDLLALQECKVVDEDFPREAIEAAGYYVITSVQKTYNGVAILSKVPATDVVTDLPGFPDPERRVIGASFGDVRLLNLYVPNGQAVDTPKFAYKLSWLEALADYVKAQLAAHSKLVVLGDFNIAPDERDVDDPEVWVGRVLFSDRERAAFQGLLALGLSDTFRLFPQEERLFSWWDYRFGAFRRNRGLRIDHILASETMRRACFACYIDKDPRGWERPSDHAPVVAEFDV